MSTRAYKGLQKTLYGVMVERDGAKTRIEELIRENVRLTEEIHKLREELANALSTVDYLRRGGIPER